MPKVSELIEVLQRNYSPEDTIAYALWSRGDIQVAIDQMNEGNGADPDKGITMSDEEQDALLDEIHAHQDFTICGIDWLTLEDAIRDAQERKVA